MDHKDFPYVLLLLAGCCLVMHLFYPGDMTFWAGISLSALSGITMIVNALMPPEPKNPK